MTQNFELPNLTAIVNISEQLKPLEYLERLLLGGVKFVQLRAKLLRGEEFLEVARESVGLVRRLERSLGYWVPVVINDSVEISRISGADGVHLGQSDEKPRVARKVLGDRAIIGLSTHSVSEVLNAPAGVVDYLGFGPVFATGSKVNPEPVVGLEGLREGVRNAKVPVIAIGGMTAENAVEAFRCGAKSVAMISALERATDLAEVVKRIEAAARCGESSPA